MGNENMNTSSEQPCIIHDVSGSTVIEPISCELSDSIKAHIEMIEWSNKMFDEARKQLMIPKKMFGKR